MADVNEIISKEAIEGLKKANQYFIDLDGNIKRVIEESKAFNTSFRTLSATQETIVSGQKKMQQQTEKMTQIQKDEAKAIKEVENASKRLNKETIANKQALDAKVRATQNEVKATNQQLSAYDQLAGKVAIARKNYKDLAAAQGQNSKAAKDAKKEFDKLNDSLVSINQSAGQHQDDVGKYGKALDGVKGAALGLLGALGITAGLAGALKLVQGVIASTGGAADELEFTISGLKEQAQFAARAFANWDFSNFLSGLKEANKEGRRYAETLDLIGDLSRANQLQTNDIERQILEQRIIAKNKGNEIGVREAAIKEIIRLEELKLTQVQKITQKGIDNELENSAFRSKASQAEVLDFVKNYNEKVDAIKQGEKIIADITKKTTSTEATQYGLKTTVDTKGREKEYASLNAQQKESVRLAQLEKQLTDEKRQALVSAIDADQKATNEMLSGKESLIRLENSLRNELIKTEKQETSFSAKVEKQATEYEKLTSRISDLTSQMTELRLANQPVPDSMVRELISSQAQLENVKKEVEAIAAGLVKISSKAAVNIPISGSTLPLTKRDNSAGVGATESKSTLFGEGEGKEFAIEQAQVVADTTFQIMADSANAEFDLKLSLLEKEKQARLDVAKTDEQKAKIEAEYAKKAAKIKTEQFKRQKSADIIQAIINTALAVTKALPNVPLSLAAGIAGAAQIAVISAQKVPQFDAGSASTPSQFIAGERRPEFMITPSGGVKLVTRPTLFKNMAGATVIGGEETAEIMNATNQGQRVENLAPYIREMKSEIVNAITNKRELHISASGSKLTERQGEYFKTYFNRKISWVGRKN